MTVFDGLNFSLFVEKKKKGTEFIMPGRETILKFADVKKKRISKTASKIL